jgi:glucose-fructose oxidoreductase
MAARSRTNGKQRNDGSKKKAGAQRLRWAVVGQGYFAQAAVLPAFAHARRSSELVALFSDDEKKRKKLGKKYQATHALPYESYDDLLASGEVDAVYIALPNHLHREYTVRAASAGIHVLCEKPMAVTEAECREMVDACQGAGVKLMVGYRLHLEAANLAAVDLARRGKLGELRYFSSAFSLDVQEGNVRTLPTDQGGGPLYDIGIYCINAARYLFQAEPVEVTALTARRSADPRFAEIDEQVSASLRFPGERLATFTASFGAADVASYELVGTKGSLRLDPAYEYAAPITLETRLGGKLKKKVFKKTDQVAAELDYFADCVARDREPEPSGWEGLHDVRIIQAVRQSATSGRKVALSIPDRHQRPTGKQAMRRPPVDSMPPLVDTEPPSGR